MINALELSVELDYDREVYGECAKKAMNGEHKFFIVLMALAVRIVLEKNKKIREILNMSGCKNDDNVS